MACYRFGIEAVNHANPQSHAPASLLRMRTAAGGSIMATSIRTCYFLIAILATTAPASAQIAARGSPSGCDQKKALPDYKNELESSPHSSLASYCMAELLLQRREFQASVNAFRDALRGDGDPVWTKVWSYIQIGKVFDVTGQRERAVAQYNLAIQTGYNADGAVNEARELLEHPFEWPEPNERVRNSSPLENNLQGTQSGCIVASPSLCRILASPRISSGWAGRLP
jgi:tetratricopeptide (TPR) repeat protein